MVTIFTGEHVTYAVSLLYSTASGGISKSETQLGAPTLYYLNLWVLSVALVIKTSFICCYTFSINIIAHKPQCMRSQAYFLC